MPLLRIYVVLSFLLLSSIALGAPATKKKFEVQLTGASPNDDLSNLVVYADSTGSVFPRLNTTDRQGHFFDEYRQTGKPNDSGRPYYVLPHDSNRWTLSMATDLALPSKKAMDKNQRMLERLCQQVQSKWTKTDGRSILVTQALSQRGTVCLQTQDASGRPIANHAVQLFHRSKTFAFSDYETAVLSGVTDDEGKIVLRQFPGICNWVVSFPKLGHTQTGLIVVDKGSVNEIQLPRIVPYGTIRGRVHETLASSIEPGERVYLAFGYAWCYREAKIDSNGGFCIADVPLGKYQLRLKNTKTQPLKMVFLGPGEDRTDLFIEPTLEKKTQPQRTAETIAKVSSPKQKSKLPTLQGRLVDASGQGVAGAKVYVMTEFLGGMRMSQETKETTTDEQGTYEFKDVNFKFGPIASFGSSIALVGHVAGRPLAIGAGGNNNTYVLVSAGGPTIGVAPEEPFPAVFTQPDLFLPTSDQGGKLCVTTLREGMPLEGVLVKIELMDFRRSFSSGWVASRTSDSLNQLLTPSKKTDITGEAAFENLTPGLYSITATVNKNSVPQTSVSNQVHHIPVTAGESRAVHMAISGITTSAIPFQIQHSDRTMLTNTSIATSWRRLSNESGRSSGSKIDDQGLGTFGFRKKGLWRLSVHYLTPSIRVNTNRLRVEPSYVGVRHIAVSQLMQRKTPLLFQTQKIAPATIRVFIEDENGKPVQGVVSLDADRHGRGFQGRERWFASTDTNGSVRFERVHSGTHKLRAFLPAQSTTVASLSANDTEFMQQFAIPEQVVELSSGELTTVRLRRQQMAYIRGRLVPPLKADERIRFDLVDTWWLRRCETHIDWSRESGEFVIGPLLPGKHPVEIRKYLDHKAVALVKHTFNVQQPGLHREDLPYHPREIPDIQRAVSQTRGSVFEDDGKTPVYAARIAAYSPGLAVSHAGTWSNARGKFALRPKSHRMTRHGEETDPDGSPRQPIIVAWLPGSLGATILRLPIHHKGESISELKIVLPAQAVLEGTVTVAGKSPQKLPSVIRILAQYRGRGKLNPMLSVMGTANLDGSYRLEGLTPGKYDVQACLDGIWTSASRSLEVPAKGPFKQSIHFNVPAPGDTAQYRLLDQANHPLANLVVRIKSLEAEGPFSMSTRPSAIKTDSEGVLYLEGLSAGVHSAELDGDMPSIEFRVPSIGSPMSAPLELHVE